jgi:DNA-binding beta-propeller fold protein YncE
MKCPHKPVQPSSPFSDTHAKVVFMPFTRLFSRIAPLALILSGAWSCRAASEPARLDTRNATAMATDEDGAAPSPSGGGRLPLQRLADIELPGNASRFDYQEIDASRGQLVIAHMNQGSVLVVDLKRLTVLKELSGIPTARGVAIAAEAGIIFVTSSPDQLVLIDSNALTEITRVKTGRGPDGVAWDSTHKIVGISDQGDGALSLIANSGSGARTQVVLGRETGNVIYDRMRGVFWITAVQATAPDTLVAVDPGTAKVTASIGLPGCNGAHGLRLHPDGRSAFIACEGNEVLARVELGGSHAIATHKTGAGPDVLAVDAALAWLYVAAESGDLTVFDIRKPGLALVGHDSPGDHAHTVAVDDATHRVFFPLVAGPKGTPILRIMQPSPTP